MKIDGLRVYAPPKGENNDWRPFGEAFREALATESGIRSVIGSVKTLGEARDLTRTGIVRELTRIVANTEERRAFYQAALDAFQSIGPVEIKKEVSVVNVNGDGLIGFYDDSILLNQGTAIHDSVQELEELVLKVRTPDPDWGLFSVYELKSIDEKGYTHGRS